MRWKNPILSVFRCGVTSYDKMEKFVYFRFEQKRRSIRAKVGLVKGRITAQLTYALAQDIVNDQTCEANITRPYALIWPAFGVCNLCLCSRQ